MARCFGDGDPLYAAYHDQEWGRPVLDTCGLLERICLEGFQAGLSWRLVLGRRSALQTALGGFEPATLAAFGPGEIEAALASPGVIRHRGKVEAAVANARATIALQEAGETLADLVWAHRPVPGPAPSWPPPAHTPESTALAKRLRRAGFRFVGPIGAYALMQACGLVNDHRLDCPVHAEVAAAQRTAVAARQGSCPRHGN